MSPQVPDKRAVDILMKTYWSPAGWRRPPTCSPDDRAYAQDKGVMFPPVALSHGELVARVLRARERLNPKVVADAFTDSLVSRRLDLRSALGSFAIARNLRAHSPEGSKPRCAVCGATSAATRDIDLDVLNFERFKWGGVRHDNPEYIHFDLEQFPVGVPCVPSMDAVSKLREVLRVIKKQPSEAKLLDLERSLGDVIKSNQSERRQLIAILGYAGILHPSGRQGYFDGFCRSDQREHTPWSKDDWPYPVRWWRGSDGLNESAAVFWFGPAAYEATRST